jgi:hypothetical protein
MARLWKSSSFRKLKPGDPGYVSATATKWRIIRGKDAGAIVSNAEKVKRTKGAHPSKLSAARKAGTLGYKSAATEAQATKQRATHRLFSRKFQWLRTTAPATHPFLNKAGIEQSASFRGRDLAIMQGYRDDVCGRIGRYGETKEPGALQSGDGSALKKYDHIKIYDVDGNRVRPETDVNKLRQWWDRKSVRQRNEFERELFYSKNVQRLGEAA